MSRKEYFEYVDKMLETRCSYDIDPVKTYEVSIQEFRIYLNSSSKYHGITDFRLIFPPQKRFTILEKDTYRFNLQINETRQDDFLLKHKHTYRVFNTRKLTEKKLIDEEFSRLNDLKKQGIEF